MRLSSPPQLWQGVHPGLNALVRCTADECPASGSRGVCPIGFGQLDVGMDLPDVLSCPVCSATCDHGAALELLCADCVWSGEGRLAGGGPRQQLRGAAGELGVALQQVNALKWRALVLSIEPMVDRRLAAEGRAESSGHDELPTVRQRQSHTEEVEAQQIAQIAQQQRRQLAAARTIQRASRAKACRRRGTGRERSRDSALR